MHEEAYDYVAKTTRFRQERYKSVLEFGSLNINGSVRELFDSAVMYWGVDLQEGRGVDQVADAADLRMNQKFDCVVCCEVMEHSDNMFGLVESAAAHLRMGGDFIVTCATNPRAPHSAVDGGPLRAGEYYRNVDPFELERLCEYFFLEVDNIEIDHEHGDLYLLAFLS